MTPNLPCSQCKKPRGSRARGSVCEPCYYENTRVSYGEKAARLVLVVDLSPGADGGAPGENDTIDTIRMPSLSPIKAERLQSF